MKKNLAPGALALLGILGSLVAVFVGISRPFGSNPPALPEVQASEIPNVIVVEKNWGHYYEVNILVDAAHLLSVQNMHLGSYNSQVLLTQEYMRAALNACNLEREKWEKDHPGWALYEDHDRYDLTVSHAPLLVLFSGKRLLYEPFPEPTETAE